MCLCSGEGSVQILVDFKTQKQCKTESTGDGALIAPRRQEKGIKNTSTPRTRFQAHLPLFISSLHLHKAHGHVYDQVHKGMNVV